MRKIDELRDRWYEIQTILKNKRIYKKAGNLLTKEMRDHYKKNEDTYTSLYETSLSKRELQYVIIKGKHIVWPVKDFLDSEKVAYAKQVLDIDRLKRNNLMLEDLMHSDKVSGHTKKHWIAPYLTYTQKALEVYAAGKDDEVFDDIVSYYNDFIERNTVYRTTGGKLHKTFRVVQHNDKELKSANTRFVYLVNHRLHGVEKCTKDLIQKLSTQDEKTL